MPHFSSPPQKPLLTHLNEFEKHIGYFPDEEYLNGFVIVQKNGLYGIYKEINNFQKEDNEQFREYLPLVYKYIDFYYSGKNYKGERDFYFGLTNEEGKKAIDNPGQMCRSEFKFDELAGEYAPLICFRQGTRYGLLNLREFFIREFYFSEGLEIDIHNVAPATCGLLGVPDKAGKFALFTGELKQVTRFCFEKPPKSGLFGNINVTSSDITKPGKARYEDYLPNEFYKKYGC